jgi:hypothetical protein
MNRITIADISPIFLRVSSKTTRGSPLNNSKPPKAKGPTIMPPTNSPKTIGNFNLANISANIFAAKSNTHNEITT